MNVASIAFNWDSVYSRDGRYYLETDGARYLLELTVTEAPYGPPRSQVLPSPDPWIPIPIVEALESNPRVWEHIYDPEPQPGDGPDYHAEHAAWRARQK